MSSNIDDKQAPHHITSKRENDVKITITRESDGSDFSNLKGIFQRNFPLAIVEAAHSNTAQRVHYHQIPYLISVQEVYD